jgi:hypothetical protein
VSIRSASAVTGPFAPSTITFARMLDALSAVICASSAAGIRTSTSIARSSPLSIRDTPGSPSSVRWGFRFACSIAFATSMPFGSA